jgi:hypothetical protein
MEKDLMDNRNEIAKGLRKLWLQIWPAEPDTPQEHRKAIRRKLDKDLIKTQ